MEWAARCLTAGNACAGDMYRLPGQKWQFHGRVGQASMTHLYEEVRHPGTIEDVMELDSSIDPAEYKAAAMEAFDR